MTLTEFRIGVAKTINLGSYESLRIEAQVVYSVDEHDKLQEISTKAEAELKYLLNKPIKNNTQEKLQKSLLRKSKYRIND